MNPNEDNTKDIEADLRSLVPTRPSPQFAERFFQALQSEAAFTGTVVSASVSTKLDWRRAAMRLGMGLAACLSLMGILWVAERVREPASGGLATTGAPSGVEAYPVESSRQIHGAEESGIVEGPDGQLYRRMRVRYDENVVWSASNSSGEPMKTTVPREQIILVPVQPY